MLEGSGMFGKDKRRSKTSKNATCPSFIGLFSLRLRPYAAAVLQHGQSKTATAGMVAAGAAIFLTKLL